MRVPVLPTEWKDKCAKKSIWRALKPLMCQFALRYLSDKLYRAIHSPSAPAAVPPHSPSSPPKPSHNFKIIREKYEPPTPHSPFQIQITPKLAKLNKNIVKCVHSVLSYTQHLLNSLHYSTNVKYLLSIA